MTERRLVNNSVNLEGKDIFKLINDTIIDNNFKNIVSYFCEILSVSRSGYYNYLNTLDKQRLMEDKYLEARDNIIMAYNYRGFNKGSRSIKMLLQDEFSITYRRKKIQRIMRKYNIKVLLEKLTRIAEWLKPQKKIGLYQIY